MSRVPPHDHSNLHQGGKIRQSYATEGGMQGGTGSGEGGSSTTTGAGGVTVQDEGSPLTTAADTLNFVGAGVVASGAGTTKTVTITGSGAPDSAKYVTTLADGGLSAEVVRPWLGNYFAETGPGSANATYDDEFDDTSGMSGTGNGLAAKWAWRNQGSATATFGKAGWLSLAIPASSTNSWRILEISALADGTYDCLMSLEGVNSDSWTAGIVLVDGTNGDFYSHGVARSSGTFTTTGWGLAVQRWTNTTTFLSSNLTLQFATHNRVFLRVTKASTTLGFWVSMDGIGWQRQTSFTDAVTVTRIGIGVTETNNTGLTVGHFDYFRKVA